MNNHHHTETFFEQLSNSFYHWYLSFLGFFKKRVKNKIPASEENPEAFALFAGIYKSEKFTIDAACQAFSGVVCKKEQL